MSGLFRHRTFLERRELRPAYDVVIIGGGVNGLSLAHNLASRHGIDNVAVLDAKYIGSGGSGRNTQVVRANYNTPETVPLYKASLGIWRTLSQELDFNLLFSTEGELDLCHTWDSLEVERDKSLLNRAYGVQTDIVTPDEIARMNPLVDLTGGGEFPIVGASFHPPGSIARHDSVVWGYAASATRRGVHVHEQTEVTGIDVVDGRAVGVRTTRGPIAAGRVAIVAAGHASVVAALAGVALPLQSHPLQALVTELLEPLHPTVVMSNAVHVYVSQAHKGELVMGAGIDSYNSYAQRGSFHVIEHQLAAALELFPIFARAHVLRTWAGIVDVGPDASPIIGRTPVEDLFVNCGWGTGGFKATPASGWVMAATLATGEPHELARPYALDRFTSGALIDEHGAAAVAH